jgi:hypothetical protein
VGLHISAKDQEQEDRRLNSLNMFEQVIHLEWPQDFNHFGKLPISCLRLFRRSMTQYAIDRSLQPAYEA